ncbi:phosphotransferase family protein [Anaerobacillus sp. MEB173]|uniref:phosphotransferase family protein n=1 Tax=Anaerobacillus sp. MEB173 TaxID=3383345 RepID=UPI003F90BAE8
MEKKQAPLPPIDTIISAYESSSQNTRKVIDATLVSSTPKIRKMIVEYLVRYQNQEGELKEESLIGKVYSDEDKGLASYQFLKYLWENGFDVNPQHTIVRPITYLKQWRMLLMSKSPGKTMDDWIHDPNVNSKQLSCLVADWLTQLHSIPLTTVRTAARTRATADINRFYDDLVERLPQEKERLISLYLQLAQQSKLLKANETVLLHGDFHTKNLFISGQRVIAIDFDHHFAGDPAWDIAYLACQIQVSSFFKKGDFDYLKPMVKCFIERYLDSHPTYKRKHFLNRLAIYSARSLFESLHYELCVLNTGKFSIVDPFLTKCELYLKGIDVNE